VRRVTAEVKSDSLLGTDHTIADFYGFADRVVNWNWKFLGWKITRTGRLLNGTSACGQPAIPAPLSSTFKIPAAQ
jgi:hypothetical protein